MKRNFTKIILLSLVFVMTSIHVAWAQAQVLKIDAKTSSITVFGTSNLHDWQTKARNIAGEFGLNANKQVQAMTIKIPVSALKSGKGMMDDITYETFNSEKFPHITFQLTEVASPVLNAEKEVHVTLTGNLSMAGVSRKVSFKAVGKTTSAGVYRFSASLPVKMSDYKMVAPVAMFGALKVADSVTLKLDINILSPI